MPARLSALLAFLLAPGLAPGAALACPTVQDLPGGIEVTYDDGSEQPFTLIYQRRPDGAIEELEDYSDGEIGVVATADGILETEYFTITAAKPNSRENHSRYTYSFTLPQPLPNWQSFSGTQSEMAPDGTAITIPAKVNILGSSEARIGACTYTVTELETFYFREDAGTLQIRQAFVPDLGFAYLLGYWEASYDASIYTPLSIRALP